MLPGRIHEPGHDLEKLIIFEMTICDGYKVQHKNINAFHDRLSQV